MKVDAYPKDVFAGEDFGDQSPRPMLRQPQRVQVRATLHNADHRLLPGMYATLDIQVGQPERYITLPQTAITYSPYGDSVYVVDDKGKGNGPDGKPQLVARQTFVTTGPTRGDQVACR